MFFLRLRSSMAVRSYRNGNDCGISVFRKCNTSFTFSNDSQRVSISSFVVCSVKLTSLNFNFSCSVRPLAFSTRKLLYNYDASGSKFIFIQCSFPLSHLRLCVSLDFIRRAEGGHFLPSL